VTGVVDNEELSLSKVDNGKGDADGEHNVEGSGNRLTGSYRRELRLLAELTVDILAVELCEALLSSRASD
jgi:hypothetical protein